MSKPVPHLERRPTGFFWRRRVPVAIASHFANQVFCFPLKTNVLREAAVVAPRITAIADTCFRAEIDVPPDVMTRLLVTYARLEIAAADRLRALLGPRTREAAEASLSLETAIRSSLRDAIFLCEREPAFQAVESTARYLGIEIAGDDADLPILADRMLRLMLEVSDERERRARGQFLDRQPYLDLALTGGLPDQHALTAPTAAEVPRPVGDAGVNATPPPLFFSQRKQAPPIAMTTTGQPVPEMAPADALIAPPQRAGDIVAQRELRTDHVLFGEDGLTIRFSAPSAPAVDPSRTVQDLPRLFDLWFANKATGTVKQGNLEVTDENLAETFLRNGDTIRSTRRILADFFGTRPASDISDVDWQAFVTFMRRIPKNHGKSPAKRHQPLALAITEADKADAARCAQAQAAEDHRARQSGSAAVKLKRSQVTALVDRLSARTVQRHQMTIASVLDHAVEVGLIPQHGFRCQPARKTDPLSARKIDPPLRR